MPKKLTIGELRQARRVAMVQAVRQQLGKIDEWDAPVVGFFDAAQMTKLEQYLYRELRKAKQEIRRLKRA